MEVSGASNVVSGVMDLVNSLTDLQINHEKLNQKADKLVEENAKLEEELTQLHLNHEKLLGDYDDLKEMYLALLKKYNDLSTENEDNAKENAKIKKQCAEAVADKNTEIQSFVKQKEEYKKIIAEMKTEYNVATDEKNAIITDLENKNGDYEKQIAEMKAECDKAVEDKSTSIKDLKKENDNYGKQIEKIQKEYDEMVADTNAMIAESQREALEFKGALDKCLSDYSELKTTNADLEEAIAVTTTSLSANRQEFNAIVAQKALTDKELVNLRADLVDMRTARQAADQRHVTALAEINERVSNCETTTLLVQQKYDSCSTELTEKSSKIQDLENDKKALDTKYKLFKEEADKKVSDAESAETSVNEELVALREHYFELHTAKQNADSQITAAQALLADRTSEFNKEKLRAQAEWDEAYAKQAVDNANLDESLQNIKVLLANKEKNYKDAVVKIEQQQLQIDQMDAECVAVSFTQQQHDQCLSEITVYSTQIDKLNADHRNELAKTTAEHEGAITIRDVEIVNLQLANGDLKTQITESENVKRALQKLAADLTKEIDENVIQIQHLKGKIDEVQDQNENGIEEKNAEIQRLTSYNKEKEAINGKITSELNKVINENAILSGKLDAANQLLQIQSDSDNIEYKEKFIQFVERIDGEKFQLMLAKDDYETKLLEAQNNINALEDELAAIRQTTQDDTDQLNNLTKLYETIECELRKTEVRYITCRKEVENCKMLLNENYETSIGRKDEVSDNVQNAIQLYQMMAATKNKENLLERVKELVNIMAEVNVTVIYSFEPSYTLQLRSISFEEFNIQVSTFLCNYFNNTCKYGKYCDLVPFVTMFKSDQIQNEVQEIENKIGFTIIKESSFILPTFNHPTNSYDEKTWIIMTDGNTGIVSPGPLQLLFMKKISQIIKENESTFINELYNLVFCKCPDGFTGEYCAPSEEAVSEFTET
uniref:restin homolog n=1 Tax=Styela clava TaxID=7725 RepID=UPI00193A849A|nr:restin homolog [Styela clava]